MPTVYIETSIVSDLRQLSCSQEHVYQAAGMALAI
jgi:hypothetical protein